MFCPNCGAAVAAGTNFCANCGAKLIGVTTPISPAPVNPYAQDQGNRVMML